MRVYTNRFSMLRLLVVLAAAAVLVGSVTFAALRSQNNIVSGSHMLSASANLMLSKQADTGYANTIAGYDFFDIVPGGNAGPANGNDLYLKNTGSTDLDMFVSLNPARMAAANGASAARTYLVIYDQTGSTTFGKYSLESLADAYFAGKPLPLNMVTGKHTTEHLKLRMQLDSFSDTAQQQEIENIDLVFSGTVV